MFRGKWTYIWKLKNIFNGDLDQIIQALKDGNIMGVAIKLHNGWSSIGYDTPDMMEFRELCREEEIGFVGWGYIYLKYNAAAEGRKALEMIEKYDVDGYLIDAEAEAKHQNTGAQSYVQFLRNLDIPIGLASYRFPTLHMELPWGTLRSVCDFDSPQMYYRQSDPVQQLARCKHEFSIMYPKLPMFPAGDMYYEHGFKPSVLQVHQYLTACLEDPDIEGTLMWSMDQMGNCPELWNEFVTFDWKSAPIDPPINKTDQVIKFVDQYIYDRLNHADFRSGIRRILGE